MKPVNPPFRSMWMVKTNYLAPAFGIATTRKQLKKHMEEHYPGYVGVRYVRVLVKEIR